MAEGGGAGSYMKQKVNKVVTKHGVGLKMPMTNLQGAAGMAKGGWIAGAVKHPGALHRELGVPEGKKIPAAKLAAAAKAGGKLGQRARLAQTLKKFAEGGTITGFKEGGAVKEEKEESPAMVKKEVDFFKKKGAPKSMIKHEERELAQAKKGFAKGGFVRGDGCAQRGHTKGGQR